MIQKEVVVQALLLQITDSILTQTATLWHAMPRPNYTTQNYVTKFIFANHNNELLISVRTQNLILGLFFMSGLQND